MTKQSLRKLAQLTRITRRARRLLLLVSVSLSMMVGTILPAGASVADKAKVKRTAAGLTTDQRVLHLLDRITFGPRPGDVERVKQMGIDRYVDLQLHPDRIDDSALQSRLRLLPSLHIDVQEASQQYPSPVLIARQLGISPAAGANGGGANAVGPNAAPRRRQQYPNGRQSQPPGPQSQPPDSQLPPDEAGAGNQQPNRQPNQQADAAVALQQKENREMIRDYYLDHNLKQPQMLLMELQAEKIVSAVYSERQLQEVLTDFWFNHFNIYWPKGADRWMTTDYVMNAIEPHALGKFKDLLMATAKSPAMLFYLDNAESSVPGAKPPQRPFRPFAQRRGQFGQFGRPFPPGQGPLARSQRQGQAAAQFNKRKSGINENYGRELMELHTLGVDGGYTQKDVQEVARCFTGWTIEQPLRGGRFVYRDWMHDNGQKVVLGHVIPAGGGERDGEMVIDILAHQPATAKFISTQLCRRFVSDNPPQSLVDRVAQTYMKSDGDIREMMRTILTSPEFNSPDALRSKIKSPFELAVSAIRVLGGQTDGSPQLGQWIAKMGQPLFRYQAPTGYPDRATEWVNTGSLLERLNFAIALTSNKIPGTTVHPLRGDSDLSGDQLVRRAVDVVLDGKVSEQTLAVLNKQMKDDLPVSDRTQDDRSMRGRDGSMEGGDEMMSQAPQNRGNKGVGRYDRLPNPRFGNWPLAETVAPPQPIDPEVSKAFGLVLGAPEFQRR